jgi:hypothetical protein
VKSPRQEPQCAGDHELEKRRAYLWSTPDEKKIAAELRSPMGLILPVAPQYCYSYGDRERPSAKRSTFAHNHRG